MATGRPSRFLGSLGDDTPFKPPPFTLCHQDTVSDRALALDFAAVPKFSRDSHKLPGLLSPHSRELPDTLRSRDFKARAHLLSLIHAHESARYASTIGDGEPKSHKQKESQLAMALRMSERITANHTIPLLQSAITEALAAAVAIRRETRTKALQGCKSNIIRITLQGRSLLCPTPFHPEAITQAEECARNAPLPPPVLHVNIDGGRLRTQSSSTSKPLHGGGPRFPANKGRGSGPHVSRGWGQRSHKGSASSFRGTRKTQPEKTPKSDSPLPLRLRASLQHWSFASPMAQRVIRKGLTWKWVNKPPAPLRPPPSTCRGTLTHHISRFLAEGIIAEVPLQRCFPSHLFSAPQDFRPRRGKSGHRPLFPQPSHSLSHLQDVHSLEAEELSPQRRLLHFHRHFRRLPPLPHPHALPEVPCLHSRRQALLLPGHAIWDKHRPSHFFPDRDRGSQIPPQHRYFSLGLHRRSAPVERIRREPLHFTRQPQSTSFRSRASPST